MHGVHVHPAALNAWSSRLPPALDAFNLNPTVLNRETKIYSCSALH
jgi:hypothetical protein